MFGLAALAQAMGDLFAVVRLLGGLYLVWLGVRAWTAPPPPLRDSTGAAGHWGGWMSGLLITLGNPKVILFYLGFLPTFIDVASLSVSDLLVLSTVVSSVLGAVLGGYALLAARARAWVRSRRARRVGASEASPAHRLRAGAMTPSMSSGRPARASSQGRNS